PLHPLPTRRNHGRDIARPRPPAQAGRRGHQAHRLQASRVLVVSGAIAGYCAALAAGRDGAEVTVVARAPGATALYAGAMEIVDEIESTLQRPNHPLTRLGIDAVGLATELDTAVSTLLMALGKEGLTFEGT